MDPTNSCSDKQKLAANPSLVKLRKKSRSRGKY